MKTLDEEIPPRRHLLIAALQLATAILFGWLFYVRYWRYRDCIAEALSSCVTPEGDNLTTGGSLWGLPALAFLVAAAFRLRRYARAGS